MSNPVPPDHLEVKVGLSGQYLVQDTDFEDAWIKTDTVVSLPVDAHLSESTH